jgi:hypothetical protein
MPIRDRLEHLIQMFGTLHPAEQVDLDRRRRRSAYEGIEEMAARIAAIDAARTDEDRESTAA